MSAAEKLLLREPWDGLGLPEESALARQRAGATFGIWIFIASEVLFFGAIILLYTVMRLEHPDAFAAAARETNLVYGTLNTALLLTSGMLAAVASRMNEGAGARRTVLWCLAATVGLGLAFLAVKGIEYREDIGKHLVPGPGFPLPQPPAQLFFAVYWFATAIHGIHLAIGIGLVARLVVLGWRDPAFLPGNPQVEVSLLYWGFVDIVWIFLYPLLYLPGRAG
ncbi:cytochrome c oxidase subunit 3 [Methylobacterium oxalidis]|uniref:cytochrome c oxidase subunit 3 n=1 Tax=Methylobacterium oxalidis TaxID=944322 RepID=UPI003315C943